MDLPLIYIDSCPNCYGNIEADRLDNGNLCKKCVKEDIKINNFEDLLDKVETINGLSNYKNLLDSLNQIKSLFKKAINNDPLPLQESWIIKILMEHYVPIIAPTGMGKTTLGAILSMFFALNKKRTIILVPTKVLVDQIENNIKLYNERCGINCSIGSYYSGKDKSVLKNIKYFDIFITTSRFALKNAKHLNYFDFYFVDDVDAIMKSKKSSFSALLMFGFKEDDINELLKSKTFDSIEKARSKIKEKTIVFSSATVYRSNNIISNILGFKPGGAMQYLRDIIDSYIEEMSIEKLIELVKKLGSGGLIFLPVDKTELSNEIKTKLNEINIKTDIADFNTIEQFRENKLDILIGAAVHYGVLVRGIDLPNRIKYAIFFGIPKFRFRVHEKMHPIAMIRLLAIAARIANDKEGIKLAANLRNKLNKLTPAAINVIYENIKRGIIEDKEIENGYNLLNKLLSSNEILNKINEKSDFVIKDGFISTPDYLTYIQASGRTSRLLSNRLTKGLSIIFVDDKKLFDLLQERLKFLIEEMEFKRLDKNLMRIGNLSLKNIKNMLETSRVIGESKPYNIKTILFVVESPNKAKTISKFFSKPTIRILNNLIVYEVSIGNALLSITATQGHVYDLTTRDIGLYGVEINNDEFLAYYSTIKRCENGHQFTDPKENACPKCNGAIRLDKINFIKALQLLAFESDEVIIGTDPDVEGERIAWDIYLLIKPFNQNIMRGEFHEVTKHAIINAIEEPRAFNKNMLYSQLARRIEDRWLGFKLSQKLQYDFWKEYSKSNNINKALSAGRVQTPVLGWIIERYDQFLATRKGYTLIDIDGLKIEIEGYIRKEAKINVNVKKMKKDTVNFGPLPPYTTSTLLEDASKLGLTTDEIMKVAQDLFEAGLITYHRTDSIRISSYGIKIAEEFMKETLGTKKYKKYFEPRSWSNEGAHEAIRPTKPISADKLISLIEEGEIEINKLSSKHLKVYNLIFKRFILSQMKPISIVIANVELEIIAEGKKFDKKISEYIDIKDKAIKEISNYIYLPKIRDITNISKVGKIIGYIQRSEYPLYSEGDIVKIMKDKGIGRPSTYATIISTLKNRNYISEVKIGLIPTRLGRNIYSYLYSKYRNLISEEVTKELLEKMDMIETGKLNYKEVIAELLNEIKSID